jgi:ParB-like chromosome segregation protein Spo0J
MSDERAAEGVDHLQAAALEAIEAARAFLDVLEEFAGDREKVAQAVEAVGSFAQAAARAGSTTHETTQNDAASDEVQRIAVS